MPEQHNHYGLVRLALRLPAGPRNLEARNRVLECPECIRVILVESDLPEFIDRLKR